MAEMSDITKNYKTKYMILKALSIAMTVGPLVFYLIMGFSMAEPAKKIILSFSAISAIMMTLVSIVFKCHIRSTIFILMLGIHACISNITTLIIIMAATTLIDELLLTPLCRKYNSKYTINKEIDARL